LGNISSQQAYNWFRDGVLKKIRIGTLQIKDKDVVNNIEIITGIIKIKLSKVYI